MFLSYFYFRFSRNQPFLVIFKPLRTVYAHDMVIIRFGVTLEGQPTTGWLIGFLGITLGRHNGARIWRFWSDTAKNGLVGSALRFSPLCPIPPKNSHTQSIGTAHRAWIYTSLNPLLRNQRWHVGSALAFRGSLMPKTPNFRPFDVHLVVLDVPRSTPTMPSVWMEKWEHWKCR